MHTYVCVSSLLSCDCTLLPPSSPAAEGVYGTQSASLYCIKLWNVELDADMMKNTSRYIYAYVRV